VRTPPRIPAVVAHGRRWSADEIEARARRWRDHLTSALREGGRIAIAPGGDADGVALIAAAASRPDWFIVLPPDTRFWPRLPLPPGVTVVLPPSNAQAVPVARAIGANVVVLPDARAADGPGLDVLRNQGIVLFTSGSTGTPKPVFRPMESTLVGIRSRLDVLGLRPGAGIVSGVSLGHGQGLTRLLSAMCLGGPLALLDPIDHRAALAVLADPQYGLWSATAHFADVLGRCRLTAPAIVPRVCLVSTSVPTAIVQTFRDRFETPLRQNYSSSEAACNRQPRRNSHRGSSSGA
jgi:hypothetical protein